MVNKRKLTLNEKAEDELGTIIVENFLDDAMQQIHHPFSDREEAIGDSLDYIRHLEEKAIFSNDLKIKEDIKRAKESLKKEERTFKKEISKSPKTEEERRKLFVEKNADEMIKTLCKDNKIYSKTKYCRKNASKSPKIIKEIAEIMKDEEEDYEPPEDMGQLYRMWRP